MNVKNKISILLFPWISRDCQQNFCICKAFTGTFWHMYSKKHMSSVLDVLSGCATLFNSYKNLHFTHAINSMPESVCMCVWRRACGWRRACAITCLSNKTDFIYFRRRGVRLICYGMSKILFKIFQQLFFM